MRAPPNRWLVGGALLGAALALAGLLTCARYRIWRLGDYLFYRHVTTRYPIGSDLWWGRIKAGDSMEALLDRVRPDSVVRFGPWIEARWYDREARGVCEGLLLIARDDRLVSAYKYSCFGAQFIFDEMSPPQWAEHRAAERAYKDSLSPPAPPR